MTAPRTKALVVLAIAFALGATAGAVGMAAAARSGKVVIEGKDGRPRHWIDELQLEADLKDSVLRIYREGEEAMDDIRHRIAPQIDSLYQIIRPDVDARRAQTRAEVRALLSPPIRERYDSMVQAADKRRRESIESRNPPPGGQRDR